jgi:hypothetical protein
VKQILILMLAAGLLWSTCSYAQVPTGTPPFGSFGGGPDVINLANLNSHITAPVRHKLGRGTNVDLDLAYDNSIWFPMTSGSTKVWTNDGGWGWSLHAPLAGNVTYSETSTYRPDCFQLMFTNFIYHDPLGSTHPFNGSAFVWVYNQGPYCGPPQSLTAMATDGSGLTLFFPPDNTQATTITERSGSVLSPGVSPGGSQDALSGWIHDSNGNEITAANGVITDTLGQTVLTISGAAPNPKTLSYMSPAGTQVSYTISYKSYTVKTNFGCSGISDYGPTSNSLVDRITLPDGSFYQVNYEATPSFAGDVTGRLVSVTLPRLCPGTCRKVNSAFFLRSHESLFF